MVSARSTTFLLVFILLPLRFSYAHNHHHHKGKKTQVVAKLETARRSMKVEIYDGVPAVVETDQRKRFVVEGRKMMMSRAVVSKSNVVETENRVNKGSEKNNDHFTKVKMSDMVPLSADYYVPRPHPPKNN